MNTYTSTSHHVLSWWKYPFILVLLTIPHVDNNARCQTINWQNTVISTESIFTDTQCDTSICRTYGESLVVSCFRVPNDKGEALYHRFFVRCMNSSKYFEFDILPFASETTATSINSISYYIHDMRMSDSLCFFCGTKVTRRYFPPDWSFPNNPPSVIRDTVTVGFFGRMDFRIMLRDSDAVVYPVVLDPFSPPSYPEPQTEWHPNVQISEVPQTSSLEKLWVDNGLYVDGFKWARYQGCSRDKPYMYNSEYYDTAFCIDSARAYIIGRLSNNANNSCLVEVYSGLSFYGGATSYIVRKPEMSEEVLTDVTGNDVRILFSSRIYKDFDDVFLHDYTIGIRYKDLYDKDDDYLYNLHLYSHRSKREDYRLRDDEYGHLCRLMNYHVPIISNNQYIGESFTDKDFCLVYSCTYRYYEMYELGMSKTFVLHINMDMTENMSFELGHVCGYESFGAGGYPVSDVAYLSNSNMNRLAISYKDPFSSDYIEFIDWGYHENGYWHDHLYDSTGYDKSARLNTASRVYSMDSFLGGDILLMGGIGLNEPFPKLMTQNRDNVNNGSESDISCNGTRNIVNQNKFSYSKTKIESGLLFEAEDEIQWAPHPTTAHKKSIENTCLIP